MLPPYVKGSRGEWYSGTANAICQNIGFIERYSPEYVLILSGDHIYKMDYSAMLRHHMEKRADATIAVLQVPMAEAHRFGIMNTDAEDRIVEFEEKPRQPKSDKASMGIYIFTWPVLREFLMRDDRNQASQHDFGKNIIPAMLQDGRRMFAYRFDGYWKDVGTVQSLWEANMELIDIVPEFNLYEEYWKIYTKSEILPPQYLSSDSVAERSIIGEGSSIFGKVYNSVIGCGVTIGKDSVVRDSIIMNNATVKAGCQVDKAIIAENVKVGDNVTLGIGNEAPNKLRSDIYNSGLVTIGENSVIPAGVQIGKNTAISGITVKEDYVQGALESGGVLIKAGDRS